MSLVLGIDAGGTYTDGVILDLDSQQIVAKAKVMTTHNNLTAGIRRCLEGLRCDDFKAVKAVTLSTTLATNAIVEGRGGEAGLLLIGCEPKDRLPVRHYQVIRGGHNVQGLPQEEFDQDEAREAIRRFEGKVEAVAVSGYFSIRNPEHELLARDLVREILGVPVVCAHELSASLGFYERSITAALNARLIPVIAELIDSVQKVLDQMGISAPLLIVRGDGSLMSEQLARERPVETILSGPAASISGATFLVKAKEALVLDMGGTTTDIAILHNGVPRIDEEGAVVGGWATRVRAAEINTYGVGGDSYIQVDREGRILVGPRRVLPLALAVCEYPYLLDELRRQEKGDAFSLAYSQPADCYLYAGGGRADFLSDTEKEALEILKNGPHTLSSLAEMMDVKPYLLNLEPLVDAGVLWKASVTPTDILHARGLYTPWNREAAVFGIRALAQKKGVGFEEFLELAWESILEKLFLAILQSVLNFENVGWQIQDEPGAMYFVNRILKPGANGALFNCALKFDIPLVAIGAPVQAYLPEVAKKLNMELIIPPATEVANAVGAASGKVVEVVEVLIKSRSDGGFTVHTPCERKEFDSLAEASEYARSEAMRCAELKAKKAGAAAYRLNVDRKDLYIREWDLFIESSITATAVGWPVWQEKPH
ncbi:MAG: hypothetical protein PWQ99_864 [Clostridia bacterium]|nr:hypothetical protein [Clostridia bacterium]